MRAWPKMSRTVKWGGVFVAGVLVVVGVASHWIGAWWCLPSGMHCGIGAGAVQLGQYHWESYPAATALKLVTIDSPWWCLWPDWRDTAVDSSVTIPLWPLAALAAAASFVAWRRDARARHRTRAHLCPRCGYDRAGLTPSSPCPECNTPAPAPPSA